MSVLIITYNENYDKVNFYDHDQILYLFRSISSQIKKCKYSDIIKKEKIEEELIDCISKYKDNFDHILFLDNKNEYNINSDKIMSFKKPIPSSWKLNGSFNSGGNSESNQIFNAGKFNPNLLFVNCKNITDQDIKNMEPVMERNVFFPFFSKIVFENYFDVFESKSLGITKNKNNDNILL